MRLYLNQIEKRTFAHRAGFETLEKGGLSKKRRMAFVICVPINQMNL